MESPQNIDFNVFNLIMKNLIKENLANVSVSDFETTLPVSLSGCKTKAATLHGLCIARIEKDVAQYWDLVCEKEDLQTKYNILQDAKVKYANFTKPAWRPIAGDLEEQLKPQRCKILLKKQKDLTALVDSLENDLESLIKLVTVKRAETQIIADKITKIRTVIPQKIQDIDKCISEDMGVIDSLLDESTVLRN